MLLGTGRILRPDDAIAAIRQLMHPPVPKRRPIGFTVDLCEKV
jgi:hypothetical protein